MRPAERVGGGDATISGTEEKPYLNSDSDTSNDKEMLNKVADIFNDTKTKSAEESPQRPTSSSSTSGQPRTPPVVRINSKKFEAVKTFFDGQVSRRISDPTLAGLAGNSPRPHRLDASPKSAYSPRTVPVNASDSPILQRAPHNSPKTPVDSPKSDSSCDSPTLLRAPTNTPAPESPTAPKTPPSPLSPISPTSD